MKSEEEIKDLYFDVIFEGIPEDMTEEYRKKYNEDFNSCVEGSFGFARHRINIRLQELKQEIKDAFPFIFRFIK